MAGRAGVCAYSGNILANHRGRRSRHLDVCVRSAVPAGDLASARQFVFELHCPSRRACRRDCRNKIYGAYICHRVARGLAGRVSVGGLQLGMQEMGLLCLRHRRWHLAVYALALDWRPVFPFLFWRTPRRPSFQRSGRRSILLDTGASHHFNSGAHKFPLFAAVDQTHLGPGTSDRWC